MDQWACNLSVGVSLNDSPSLCFGETALRGRGNRAAHTVQSMDHQLQLRGVVVRSPQYPQITYCPYTYIGQEAKPRWVPYMCTHLLVSHALLYISLLEWISNIVPMGMALFVFHRVPSNRGAKRGRSSSARVAVKVISGAKGGFALDSRHRRSCVMEKCKSTAGGKAKWCYNPCCRTAIPRHWGTDVPGIGRHSCQSTNRRLMVKNFGGNGMDGHGNAMLSQTVSPRPKQQHPTPSNSDTSYRPPKHKHPQKHKLSECLPCAISFFVVLRPIDRLKRFFALFAPCTAN